MALLIPHRPQRAVAVLLLLGLGVLLAAGPLRLRARSGAAGLPERTIPLGGLPAGLALTPGRAGLRAFVADDGAATVSVLDLARGQRVRVVPVGAPTDDLPLALAVAPTTQRVFVGIVTLTG